MFGRQFSKISLVVLCAVSFSSFSLTSQNAFAQDQENLESDFDMQEPPVVDEPAMNIPAPSEPADVEAAAPPTVPAKHKAVKNKKEAAKAAKKSSKAAKHDKKDKKSMKDRTKAKIAKKNKNKKKKS